MKSKLFTILCISSFLFFNTNVQAQFNVTFQVDMCEQIAAGNFDPATQALYVTGGNANQSGNFATCGLAMTDADMDGVYDITQSYPDAYQVIYKFFIGVPGDAGTDNCDGSSGGYEPNLPAPCGFGGFADRTFTVNGDDSVLPVVCYGSCDACTTCACDLILAQGTTSCDDFTSGDDTYTASFSFSQTTAPGAGTYTILNGGGTLGGDDPNLVANGVITISGLSEAAGTSLTVQDGAGCDLFQALAPAVCVPSFDVTFQVDMCEQIALGVFDPATQALYVTGGNANQSGNFATCGLAMTDADMDGVYDITQSYPDGYQVIYKFFIGVPGDAGTDNCNGAIPPGYEPALSTAECGIGGFGDREFVVNGADATVPTVCYGSCVACTTCACDLILVAGTATCDALTSDPDTYSATFTFMQAAAPGAGTYTLTTNSGGTIGGDDPNTVASGTITITGITEGTDADLNIIDGAACDLSESVASPACLPLYDITFQVNMCERITDGTFDPATETVYVTGGNANQSGFYGTCGQAMVDSNGDGAYELTQSYPDGYAIAYKFYVGFPGDAGTNNCDGSIAGVDPELGYEAPLAPCGVGAFGDREYIVSGEDAVVGWVCFNSCNDCGTCSAAIPTVGEWGLIMLLLMLMIFAVVSIKNSVSLKPKYD